jgi:hypothetical protein
MRAHKVKVWPASFRQLEAGNKTCEVRRADRDYRVEDCLVLLEFDPQSDGLTGRHTYRRITHVHRPEDVPHGLLEGFVVLSLRPCDSIETRALLGDADMLIGVEWVKATRT